MKKSFLILAVCVMAFGNANLFAQRSQRLATIEKIMKQVRNTREDAWYEPVTAVYTHVDEKSDATFRNTYTYDEYEYYLTEMLVETKNGSSWQNFEYLTYEYNFDGSPLEILSQEWDDGDWENEAFVTYTYDNEDILSEVIIQEWDDDDWLNVEKMVFNFGDYSSTVLYSYWDGVWRTEELYTYTYGTGGDYELLIQYMQGGAWQNDEKLTYTMNESFDIASILLEGWENNAWQNEERCAYNYENGVAVSLDIEAWQNGNWTTMARMNFEYEDGNATYGHYQEWTGSQWVEANADIEMFYAENAASLTFEDSNEVNVQYADLTLSVDENQVKAFKTFPNPATESIAISGEDFQKAEMYNIAGQKVLETTLNTVNVNGLPSGVYMLKVFGTNGSVETQNVVVK